MKKVILMTMVAVFLLTSTVCAFADTTAFQADSNGKYTVTYNVGTQNAGNMYGFVVIKGTDVIDLDDIDSYVYIDQATADAEGNITFANFGLKGALPSDDNFVESTAYIGGKGFDTAQAIGVLVADTACTVTGTVTDNNNPRNATVTFKNESGVTVGSATTANGVFTIELDDGTYTALFVKGGSLSFTYTGVVVDGDKTLKTVDMTGLAGDVNTSGGINLADLNALLGDYDQTQLSNEYSDVNASTTVNLADLNIVLTTYDKINVTEAYQN